MLHWHHLGRPRTAFAHVGAAAVAHGQGRGDHMPSASEALGSCSLSQRTDSYPRDTPAHGGGIVQIAADCTRASTERTHRRQDRHHHHRRLLDRGGPPPSHRWEGGKVTAPRPRACTPRFGARMVQGPVSPGAAIPQRCESGIASTGQRRTRAGGNRARALTEGGRASVAPCRAGPVLQGTWP